jgi:hypothetical protein
MYSPEANTPSIDSACAAGFLFTGGETVAAATYVAASLQGEQGVAYQ